jgi:glycosyltransferase involved in cell wall biosynthesis
MSQILVVNAVSLYSGGGAIVLNQFLEQIQDNNNYYVFVSSLSNIDIQLAKNVKLVPIKFKNRIQKLLWSSFYLKKWLDDNKIIPDILISLQNTSIRYNKAAKQIIYLHNALVFHQYKWSFLKRAEQKLVLYKWLYPKLIFLHWHDNSKIVVQTEWMQKQLLAKYKHLANKVVVIKPNINDFKIEPAIIRKINLYYEVSLFYPCSKQPFKNHIEIVNALLYLKQNNYDISNIGYYLTLDKSDVPELWKIIEDNNLDKNVIFLGSLPYKEVLIYYKSSSVIVFPSKIESCGLPLIEAMKFNKPIISIAASYARDTVINYSDVIFVEDGQSAEWAQAILDNIKYKVKIVDNNALPAKSSWSTFFEFIYQ